MAPDSHFENSTALLPRGARGSQVVPQARPRYKVLLAGVEPLERRRIRRLLADRNEFEFVAECSTPGEIQAVVAAERPDFLLVDYRMAIQFPVLQPPHQARAAFRKELLPAPDQLEPAALVALESYNDEGASVPPEKAPFLERILIRKVGRMLLVPAREIHWISAEGNYVRLHLSKGRPLLRRRISDLENDLDPSKFMRIHRSAIVSLDHVRELTRQSHGGYSIQLDTGTRLRMSRGYVRRFRTARPSLRST